MRIGEVATRTGLTVRTLRHYDQLGLLRPQGRSPAGYRQYTREDLLRLQQILSLRQLGLSLEAIGQALDGRQLSPRQVLDLQLARLSERLQQLAELKLRLTRLTRQLGRDQELSWETLLESLEAHTMLEKHYTPDQLAYLEERHRQLGQARQQQAEADWQEIFRELERLRQEGKGPAHPAVQVHARRAVALIDEFTGGDPGVARSLANLHQDPGAQALMQQHGWTPGPELMTFLGQAMKIPTS